MLPLTNPRIINQLVQLSADVCQDNRNRCARQLGYLYKQREDLAVQRQKRAERDVAEMAKLSQLCESMGLEVIPV